MTFGKRLKQLRESNGFKSQYVAEQLNVAKSTYSGYENDKTRPSFEILDTIATFFDVSIDYLLCRTDEPIVSFNSQSTKKIMATDDVFEENILMNSIQIGFNERLKFLREEHGLTQLQMSLDVNLSNVTLSQYEAGTRKPDIDTLQILADYFNVTTDYILGISNKRSFSKKTHIATHSYKNLRENERKILIEFADFLKTRHK